MSTPTPPIQYGQVWVSRDEVMGPMNLVVSSDAYNAAFGDRRVIALARNRIGFRSSRRATFSPTRRDALANPVSGGLKFVEVVKTSVPTSTDTSSLG